MEAVLLQAARDLDGATRVMEQQMREAHRCAPLARPPPRTLLACSVGPAVRAAHHSHACAWLLAPPPVCLQRGGEPAAAAAPRAGRAGRRAGAAGAPPGTLCRERRTCAPSAAETLAAARSHADAAQGLIAEIRDNLLASTAAADAAGDLTGVVPASPLPVARFTELVGGSLPEREVVPAAEPTQPSDEGADSDDDEAEQAAGDVVRARIRAKEQAAAATPAGGPPPSGRRRRRRSSTGSSRRRSTDSMVASFGEMYVALHCAA